MKKLLLPFYFILITTFFYSQPNYDWSVHLDQISGSYFLNDIHVQDIESDPSGNVYITGVFRGQVDFDVANAGGDITSQGGTPSEDAYIAKYDASGNFLWVNRIDNPNVTGGDYGTSLAVDNSGNVYVAGSMYNSGLGMFIARYTPTGTQTYLHLIAGYSNQKTEDIITLDNSGNLYLFGRYNGTKDLDPGPGTINRTAIDQYDFYLAKLTASTGNAQWVKTWGGNGFAEPYNIVTDNTYLYLTGGYTNTVDFDPDGGTANLTSVGNQDAFVARYSASTGAYDYAYSFGSSQYERGYDLTLNGNDLYFITQLNGTVDFQPGAGSLNISSRGGAASVAFVKYNKNTMVAAWGDTVPGTNGSYVPGVMNNGNLLMVSRHPNNNVDYDLSAGTVNRTINSASPTSPHVAIEYNSSKVLQSAEMIGNYGNNTNYFPSLASDNNNGFYFGIQMTVDVRLDYQNPTTVQHAEGTYGDDAFLAHYSTCISGINTTGTRSICENQTKALTSSTPGGTWTIISGGGTISGNTYTPANITVNTTVTIRYTDGCGNSTDRSFIVYVRRIANNYTSLTDICEIQTKTLIGVPSGGTWSIINGGGTITGNTYTPANVSSNTNVTIRYTIPTNGSCPATTSDRTFTVNVQNIAVNSTSTAAICENQTKTLVGSPAGGVWSVISGGGTISGNTYTPANINNNTSVVVRYTIPANGGCVATFSNRSFTVNVNNIAINSTSTATICENQTKTLIGNPTGGSWTVTNGGGTISGNTYTPANINSNTNVTIRYTIPTNGACTATTSDITFTVEPLYTPVITNSAADICVGNNRNLTATPTGGTWSIINGASFGNLTSGNILNATATGTITVQYRITNACGNQDVTQNINIVNTVVPTITNSTLNMCIGDTRNLTATPTGGNWSIFSGPGAIGAGNVLTANAAGTIQIIYNVTSSCGTGADTISIIVNPVPTVNITSLNNDLCLGTSRTLTGSPTGGVWSVISGPGSITGNILTANTSGSIQIMYDVTQNGCTGTSNQTINVIDSANATWISPGTICENAGLTDLNTYLASFANTGGIWSGHPNVSAGGIFDPTGLAGSNVTIKYKVGTSPCSDSLTLGINIQTNVNPSWTNPIAICENAGLTDFNTYLSTGSTTGGIWSGNPNITSGGIFNPSGLSGSSITIKYKVGASPCIDSMSHTFNINNAANATWTNPSTICENNPLIDLNTYITGTIGGSWGGNPNVSIGGLFNPSGLSGTTVNIYYTVGIAPCADTITHAINVINSPDATWSIPTTICESSIFDLDTLLTSSATPGGIWSGPGVSGSIFDPIGLTGPITIKYKVGSIGCIDSLAITIINIAPSPTTPIVSLTLNTICEGDTSTIMASGSGTSIVYNVWTASSGGTFLGQTPLMVNPSITTTYYIEAIAANLCTNIGGRQPITLTVNPLPIPSAGLDQTICFGDSIDLTATGGGTYIWDDNSTNPNRTVFPLTTTNYTVTVTNTNGCIDSNSVTITLITTGVADAQNDNYELTTGTQETINVYTNDIGDINTITIITPPLNGMASINNNGEVIYQSNLGYVGMDSIYYAICDPNCNLLCDTAKLVIEVLNGLTIPSGLSPNNDGKNDMFEILGVEKYPDNELYIYNRWGDQVFYAKPYNNDWYGQTEKALIGKEVIEGTYFYIFKLGKDLPQYKGYIELKK